MPFPSLNPHRLKPTLVAALVATLSHLPAWAVEPFVLKDIRIEGLQRADAGTVFGSLPFRVGDTYTDDKGAAGLRALFATLGTSRDSDVLGSGVAVELAAAGAPPLPLPVLDGGHLMYYLFEGVTGRPVSELWLERLQRGGLAVMFLMMSLALYNDFARLLGMH